MKKIACLFVMSILALISSTAYAGDGYFTCGSDVTEFSGKTFENLVIDLRGCHDSLAFDGITVTDSMKITGNSSVSFKNSGINTLSIECTDAQKCEIGLDESTSVEVLELYPGENGKIIVNGTSGKENLPAFYSIGYLCEGQKEFSIRSIISITIAATEYGIPFFKILQVFISFLTIIS